MGVITVVAVGLGSMLTNAQARKTEVRGCHAVFEMVLKDAKGVYQKVPIASITSNMPLQPQFGNPNEVRRNARDIGLNCARRAFKQKKPGTRCAGDSSFNRILNYPKTWNKVGARNAMQIEATYFQHFLHGNNTPKPTKVEFRYRSWSAGGSKHCLLDSKGKGYAVLGHLWTAPMGKKGSIRIGTIGGHKAIARSAIAPYRKHNMSKKASKSRQRLTVKFEVALGKGKGVVRSSAFAPLGRGNSGPAKELLRARKHKYVGCGRHAAQHLLDFHGHVLPMNVIGNHVKLHKGGMFATKLQKTFKNGIRQKPVMPKDIRTGLNNILSSNKESIRIFRSTKPRKSPQKAIREHIQKKGPVIALVKNGAHYVTAMGHWQPIFDKRPALGSFYTFSNGATTMYPYGEYSLKFNASSKTIMKLKLVDNSYRPGTILYAVPK
jgi:hypothetical protein